MTQADSLTRRGFVVVAGAGLTLAWVAPAAAQQVARAKHAASTPPVVQPFVQPFVQIATDSRVTVLAKHLDMGQGIWTGLSTIVAEELDADWAQMRVEGAPADTAVYKHLMFGAQSTGGSTSIANSWDQLRRAGATARAMLVQAAAQRWKVPAAEVQVAKGVVSHGKHRASFGDLAGAAAALPVPTDVVLKDPSRFTLIGPASGQKIPRLDAHAKSHGAPIYGIDAERPGMRYAVLQRPPRFGARLKNVDDQAARALPGVIDIVLLPNAVAVIASNTWAAIEARRVLAVEWDETNAEKRGSAELMDEFRRLARATVGATDGGVMGTKRGDSAAALAGAARVIEAEYEAPYLAHASLEPLCSVGEWRDGRCDIWAGIQNQTGDQRTVARILDLPIDKVALNTLYAGGSFGRRATFNSDWIGELAQVLKATRGAYPVKLMWTRDDDLHGGYYRPMNLHRLRAALGPDGRVLAVEHTIVAQSFGGQPKPGVAQRLDRYAVEGNVVERYDIPNASLRWFNPAVGVPVHTFRALSFNHTTFAKEVFMDELAKAAGRDPLEFRLAHLGSHPRQAAVLRLAADKAGWGRPLPAGSALGLSVQEANSGTFVAQVAQVRLLDGRPQVERVVCAVDCGVTLNPDIVRSQAEGGVADGLWQALHGRITLAEGRVEQNNFNDYPLLRLPQMPQVELHLLDGGGPPMGVGEPCSVPIGAAVANALVQLGGAPVRRLPMTTQT